MDPDPKKMDRIHNIALKNYITLYGIPMDTLPLSHNQKCLAYMYVDVYTI